jgi:hypothetical protein
MMNNDKKEPNVLITKPAVQKIIARLEEEGDDGSEGSAWDGDEIGIITAALHLLFVGKNAHDACYTYSNSLGYRSLARAYKEYRDCLIKHAYAFDDVDE